MDPDLTDSFLTSFYLNIPMFVASDIGGIILLLVLLFCSGLFSGSEIAMFSLTPSDIDEIREEENPASRSLIYFKDHPKTLLALLLICNTFVNIGIAILVENFLSQYFPIEKYNAWAETIIHFLNLDPSYASNISTFFSFLIAVIGATGLILLFGEVTPKIYAQLNSRKLAMFVALPLRFLNFIMTPLTYIMVMMTNKVEKRLLEKKVGLQATTKEDLDAAIDLAVSHEIESERQVGMLKGIIKFNDVSAKQVMTSRTEIYSVEFDFNFDEVLDVVRESGFSRLPVANSNFDQVTGILYIKDLVAHIQDGKDFEWQTLIRTNLHYVPESRKINDLLNDLQEKHVHMAFVVDEYGGISGLVTLEDIMEEIVGEIKDEFDDQHELNFTKLDSNNYLFDGKTLINDMCRVLGIDIFLFDEVRGSADSIAGLLLQKNHEMPKKDQELIIEGFKFKVVSLSKKRIEQIKVTI